MRRPPPRASIAGFTLIEALIATALMAAILTALSTVTAQWLPNWNRGFARVQRAETVALGMERIVGDLAVAEFVPIGRDPNQIFFDGKELSVTFARTAFGPNTRTGLEMVRIAEVAGDNGPTLVRTRAPLVPVIAGVNDRDPLRFTDPVVLLRAPYRVTFSYAGLDRVWKPTWITGGSVLPRAIRITVRDGAGQILSASTATTVHAELAAGCALAKNPLDCLAGAPPDPAAPDKPGTSSDMDNRPMRPRR